MKVKTIIEEITHDDLVNLFGTALYRSTWLDATYDKKTYLNLPNTNENDYVDVILARMLMSGHTIKMSDYYAEDKYDYHGNRVHAWDEKNKCMRYTISLQDVKDGLQLALNDDDSWHRDCATKLMYDDLDQPMAELLCQMIMFGEEIYG